MTAGTSGSVGFVDSLILEPARRTYITTESVQDLNDASHPLVVGYLTEGVNTRLAVLWLAGEPKKLDSLARKSSFQEFSEAKGINNFGDMVGAGWSDEDENHGFLMIRN